VIGEKWAVRGEQEGRTGDVFVAAVDSFSAMTAFSALFSFLCPGKRSLSKLIGLCGGINGPHKFF
jgi:hypothetical protein